ADALRARLNFSVRALKREEPKVKSQADFALQGARSAGRLRSLGGSVRGSASVVRDGSAGIVTPAVASVGANGTHGGFRSARHAPVKVVTSRVAVLGELAKNKKNQGTVARFTVGSGATVLTRRSSRRRISGAA